MYDTILLPVDGGEHAGVVHHHVAELAQWADATVELLYVADTTRDSVDVLGDDVVDSLVRYGEEVVADVGETMATLGVEYDTAVHRGRPSETIVEYADERGHDLIVMPTHGRRGIERYLLGSVTERVVRRADVPVLTARILDERFAFPYDRVLVPTDGSDVADAAVAYALDLADAMDADVDVLSAVDEVSLGLDVRSTLLLDRLEADARETVDDAVAAAEARGLDATGEIVHGSPVEAIGERVASTDAHAVVMGTTGHRGLDRILLGSVTARTVRTSDVPVFTVRNDR